MNARHTIGNELPSVDSEEVTGNAMTRLLALLCSEVEAGTPEGEALHKTVGDVFGEHCLEELASNEPASPVLRM